MRAVILLSLKVIGMFGKRKKIGTSLGSRKSGNRILRLLRSDKSYAVSHDYQEVKEQENGFEGSWKEMRNALLEAESHRAQALQMWEQSKRFC